MIDIPGQQHEPGERTRLYTQGHRIGDGSSCALLVVQEAQAWSMCDGLDPDVGIRVSKDRMILLTRAILRCEAEREIAGRPPVEPPPACCPQPAGPTSQVALCGADVTPSAFIGPPGNGHCQSCRESVPTQRSGKTR